MYAQYLHLQCLTGNVLRIFRRLKSSKYFRTLSLSPSPETGRSYRRKNGVLKFCRCGIRKWTKLPPAFRGVATPLRKTNQLHWKWWDWLVTQIGRGGGGGWKHFFSVTLYNFQKKWESWRPYQPLLIKPIFSVLAHQTHIQHTRLRRKTVFFKASLPVLIWSCLPVSRT